MKTQSEKLKKEIETLSDEELNRAAKLTPENYTWSTYAPNSKGKQCLAGHAFGIEEPSDVDEYEERAWDLSLESCGVPVDVIMSLVATEQAQRKEAEGE